MKNQIDQSTPVLAFYDLLRIRGIYSDEEKREKLRRGFRRAMALAATLVALALPQSAWALPGGLAGDSRVTTSGTTMTIHPNAGADAGSEFSWSSFNVAAGETVTIDATSIHTAPSFDVAGLVDAGSNVLVFKTPGGNIAVSGEVKAGRFFAATFDGFNKDDMHFAASAVQNGDINITGTIPSDSVLVGNTISASGAAATAVATAGMLGTSDITIASGGGTITFVGTTGAGSVLKAGTVNMGGSTIAGDDTTSVSATGEITGDFSQSGGSIQAANVTGKLTQSGGEATANRIQALTQTAGTATGSVTGDATVGGTLNAASVGGKATVSGTLNGVSGLSVGSLETSGTVTGNGDISISGSANQTGGSINAGANAIILSSGGSFAGNVTAGSISATGQTVEQTGGLISLGAGSLSAETFSQNGAGATVTAGTVDGTVNQTAGTINASSFGGAVTQSGAGARIAGTGDITFGGALEQGAGASVTANNGSGKLTLDNGGKLAGTLSVGSIEQNGGVLSDVAGNSISVAFVQNGGTATVGSFGSTVNQTAGTINTSEIGGAATIAGNLNGTGGLAVGSLTQTGGSIAADGALRLNGVASQSGGTATATALDLNAGIAAVNLNQTGNTFGKVSGTAGAVTIQDSGKVELGAITADSLTLTAGGAVTQTGATTLRNNGTATVSATGQDVRLDAENDFGTVRVTGANVQVKDANALTVSGITASGFATVQAGGNVTVSGAVSGTGGNVLVQSTGGTLTIEQAVTAGENLSLLSSGILTQNAAIEAQNGTIDIESAGDVSVNANTTSTGATRFLANGGNGTINVSNDAAIAADAVEFAGKVEGTVNGLAASSLGLSGGNITLNNLNVEKLAIKATGNVVVNNTSDALTIDKVAPSAVSVKRVAFNGNAADAPATGSTDPISGVTTSGGTIQIHNTGTIVVEKDVTATGNVTIQSDKTSDTPIKNEAAISSGTGTGGTIALNGGGAELGTVKAGTGTRVTLQTGVADLVVGDTLPTAGSYDLRASHDVTVASGVTATAGNLTVVAGHDAKIEAGLVAAGAVNATASNGALTTKEVTANGGNATLTGGSVTTEGAVTANAGNAVLRATGGAVTVGGAVNARNVAVEATGGVNENAQMNAAVAKTVRATGGNIVVDAAAGGFTAPTAVYRADNGSVTLNGDISGTQNLGVQGTTIANNANITGVNQLALRTTSGEAIEYTDSTIPTGVPNLGIAAAGNLTVDVPGALTANGANVQANAGAGNVQVQAGGIESTGGAVEVTAGGAIAAANITGANGTTVNAAGQQVNVTGNLGQGGATTVTAGGLQSGTLAGGDATLNVGGEANVGTLAVGGDVNGTVGSLTTAGGTAGSVGQNGGFQSGDVAVNGQLATGAFTADVATLDLNAGLNTGALVLNATAVDGAGQTLQATTADLNVTGAVALGTLGTTGNANVEAASYVADNTNVDGDLVFDDVGGEANVGTLDVGGDVNGTVGGLFTTAGGQVGSIGQNGGFNANGITVDGALNSGPVTVTQGGAVTLNGALNAGGSAVVLNTAATTINGGLTGGNVTINAGGPVTGGGALVANQLNIAAGGSEINLPNVQSANLNNITGGAITLTDTSGERITIGTINAGGVLNLTLNSAAGAGGQNASLSAYGTMTLTVTGPFGEIAYPVSITINGNNPVLNINGSGINESLLHFILDGQLDPGDIQVIYQGEGFAIYGSREKGWQFIGISPEKQRLLNRALAFTVNTPELKSKQGVFGDPAMLHTRMNVSEVRPGSNMDMLALKSVDFSETWTAVSEAGGELAEWTPAVRVDEDPLLSKLEALASEVQLQPEIQPMHETSSVETDER